MRIRLCLTSISMIALSVCLSGASLERHYRLRVHTVSLVAPAWLKVEGEQYFCEERLADAIKAVQEWDDHYRLDRCLIIRPYLNPDKKRCKDGSVITTLEVASPGLIELGLEGDARNIVLHAMTHASAPDKPTILPRRIRFCDGWIVGFQGLSIMVKLDDGDTTFFRVFEEGAAERNASFFYGYAVSDVRYHNVGLLTRKYFPAAVDVISLVKNNDVPGFVARVLRIPRDDVGGYEIGEAMRLYDDAFQQGFR